MKQSKKKKSLESGELTALELVEKELTICILAHTNNLGEAEEYAPVTAGAFLAKRIKYDIPTPPRISYGGPKLTQQQMVDAFFSNLAESAPAAIAGPPMAPSSNVTFVPPPNPNPLSPDPPSPPNNVG